MWLFVHPQLEKPEPEARVLKRDCPPIVANGCGQADVAGFKVRKFQFNCMLIRIPDDRGELPPAIALARC